VGNTGTYTLPSGESFSVGIDLSVLDMSVHGPHAAADVYCTDCHRDRERYLFPHQPNPAQTYHEFQANIAENCSQCHLPLELHNPGHLQADDATGLPNCVDCHGGHDVAPVDAMVADPIGTCQSCHSDIGAGGATGEGDAVQQLHARVMDNLGVHPDLSGEPATCRTCHADQAPATADAQCQSCHNLLTDTLVLPSGEEIPLQVHGETIMESVHGPRTVQGTSYPALQCVDCHSADDYEFPHTPVQADTLREYTLIKETVCQDCHEDIFARNQHSVHAVALAEGNLDAASCVDCHGAHDIMPPSEPRQRISNTCGQCHSTVHDQYATSVHGAALLGENNPDVPVCTDCHTAHDIEDPTTASFRLRSPTLCAQCHADEELMAQYGISTDVFDTYVADFHGSTVTIFEQTASDQETNKAVCYDCHGVHNILATTDENSQVIKENLLTTCQQCHPDANANFPDTWTSHFKPSWEHNRLVYVINLFYQLLIPALVGGFALFIGSDVIRRLVDRFRRKPQAPGSDEESAVDAGVDMNSTDTDDAPSTKEDQA
jgi:predicted CXXCH cytochrome family protein